MSSHDVVIIGAGPAGSAAAIFCAQQRLSVALLEQSAVCRDRPGETLPPGIEPLLQQLGVADQVMTRGIVRHSGNWVHWGTAPHFNAFGGDDNGPWHGFQIPRRLLDRALLNQAEALDVSIVRPCRATNIILKDNAVTGVESDQGVFHCTQLIDASGAKGWLARQLALKRYTCSRPLLATYGYAKGASAVCDEAPWIIADKDGWYWIAKISTDAYTWTRLNFNRHPANLQPPSEFAHLHHLTKARGADVTWRVFDPCAGAGYFLVGDAASVLDPCTSHGVLKAIMSGMMAGHTVVKGLAHPEHQSSFQRQYRQWLNHWFEHDLSTMRELYATHPAPPAWLTALPLAYR